MNRSSIFISYSRKDRIFARQLASDLEKRDIKVWIDEGEILVGDSLLTKIQKAIDEMDYLGVILTPNSVNSKWVIVEVETAMNQEISGNKVKVLPILAERCEIPNYLQRKKYANFCDNDYSAGLDEILWTLCQQKSKPAEDEKKKAAIMEIHEKWEIASREYCRYKISMNKGQLLSGDVFEEDGDDFDFYIMSERQANDYFNGDRGASTLRDYLDQGYYMIKWTAPRNGDFWLIGDIYKRQKPRIIYLDLKIK